MTGFGIGSSLAPGPRDYGGVKHEVQPVEQSAVTLYPTIKGRAAQEAMLRKVCIAVLFGLAHIVINGLNVTNFSYFHALSVEAHIIFPLVILALTFLGVNRHRKKIAQFNETVSLQIASNGIEQTSGSESKKLSWDEVDRLVCHDDGLTRYVVLKSKRGLLGKTLLVIGPPFDAQTVFEEIKSRTDGRLVLCTKRPYFKNHNAIIHGLYLMGIVLVGLSVLYFSGTGNWFNTLILSYLVLPLPNLFDWLFAMRMPIDSNGVIAR